MKPPRYLVAIAAFIAGSGLALYQGKELWPSVVVAGVMPVVLFLAIEFAIDKTNP
jgi:1,4-dihydroxy-2-naphthoate octaprenyltransferase